MMEAKHEYGAVRSSIDLGKLRFVPDALPDLNLNEISVECKQIVGNSSVECVPVAIEAEDESSAIKASTEAGHPLFYIKGSSEIVLVRDGKVVDRHKDESPRHVSNGLELAKCIRLGIEPCILRPPASLNEVVEQLRIAMFLVNSESIERLRQASIYVI